MKKLNTLSLSIFIFCSCNGQVSKNNENNIKFENINKIKLVLEKQLKEGANQYYEEAGVEIPKNKFENEEFEANVKIVNDILNSNAYKRLSNEEFSAKIKSIFGRIIDFQSTNKYLSINYLDKCDKNFNNNPNKIEFFGTYIVKNDNLITDFYYIPQILNYTKEFPEISKIENSTPSNYKNKNGDSYNIELWKDLDDQTNNAYNLIAIRKKNIQTIIARNLYLFNNIKGHFRWLVINDKIFMENLVKAFGYTEDKELLKWVIESTLPSNYIASPDVKIFKEISKLLWSKKCDGKIIINQNTLNILKELSSPEDPKYVLYVAEYIQHGLCIGCDRDVVTHNLNFEEESKILAHLLEFGEQYKYDKAYNFNQMFLGNFYYYLDHDKKYIKEFKRNNYYGLPNLEKWYLSASKEENIFKNIELEDNPQPQNYLDKSN